MPWLGGSCNEPPPAMFLSCSLGAVETAAPSTWKNPGHHPSESWPHLSISSGSWMGNPGPLTLHLHSLLCILCHRLTLVPKDARETPAFQADFLEPGPACWPPPICSVNNDPTPGVRLSVICACVSPMIPCSRLHVQCLFSRDRWQAAQLHLIAGFSPRGFVMAC